MSARITLYKQGEKAVKIEPLFSIHDILNMFNFIKTGTCNCSGIFTEKYSNNKFKLKIRPRRNQHQLFYNDGNNAITNWITITELKAKLDELTKVDI